MLRARQCSHELQKVAQRMAFGGQLLQALRALAEMGGRAGQDQRGRLAGAGGGLGWWLAWCEGCRRPQRHAGSTAASAGYLPETLTVPRAVVLFGPGAGDGAVPHGTDRPLTQMAA